MELLVLLVLLQAASVDNLHSSANALLRLSVYCQWSEPSHFTKKIFSFCVNFYRFSRCVSFLSHEDDWI